MDIISIMTEATCGEGCWHAKEDICRCSCGGKNHGIAKTGNDVNPARTSRIKGKRYELIAIGEMGDILRQSDSLLKELPPKAVNVIKCYDGKDITYTYTWKATDTNSPYRAFPATMAQMQIWKELAAYQNRRAYEKPYLLWKKIVN